MPTRYTRVAHVNVRHQRGQVGAVRLKMSATEACGVPRTAGHVLRTEAQRPSPSVTDRNPVQGAGREAKVRTLDRELGAPEAWPRGGHNGRDRRCVVVQQPHACALPSKAGEKGRS